MGSPVSELPNKSCCTYSKIENQSQIYLNTDSAIRNNTGTPEISLWTEYCESERGEIKKSAVTEDAITVKSRQVDNSCGLTSVTLANTKSTICSGDSLTISATPVGSLTIKYSWLPG